MVYIIIGYYALAWRNAIAGATTPLHIKYFARLCVSLGTEKKKGEKLPWL